MKHKRKKKCSYKGETKRKKGVSCKGETKIRKECAGKGETKKGKRRNTLRCNIKRKEAIR